VVRSITVLAAVFALIAVSPMTALPQEPIDLAIVTIEYACYPEESSYEIYAEVELASLGDFAPFVTEIAFFLDETLVGAVPYDVSPTLAHPCVALGPPCDGPGRVCWPDTINGQIIEGSCASWMVSGDCACIYLIWKGGIYGPVPPPSTCTATADPYNDVGELDETNNSMTIVMQPSAILGTEWGMIKSLYR
jgi:hypothetical protein